MLKNHEDHKTINSFMFLTSDEPGQRDYRQVTALNQDGATFQLFDYVLITNLPGMDGVQPMQWIGQITTPNVNVSPVGRPLDPTLIHAISLLRTNPKVQLAQTIESWQITLLGEYQGGRLTTLRKRPKPGATVEKLPEDLTVKILKITKYSPENPNAIGYLTNVANVPLCVERKIYTHHLLVSGGTGSGKSNTGANLIQQAQGLGFHVFLYDAKPDYRKMSNKNSDPSVQHLWPEFEKYGIRPSDCKDKLVKIGIYQGKKPTGHYEQYDMVIGFQASDFNPYAFAELFFDEKNNTNQYEEFAAVCATLLYGEDGDDESRKVFTLRHAENEINERIKNYYESENSRKSNPSLPSGKASIHQSTGDAILRKIRRAKRQMHWLDAVGQSIGQNNSQNKNAFEPDTKKVVSFSVDQVIAKASEKGINAAIVHLDCSEESGVDARTYALFLTYFLRENQRYQNKHRKQTGGIVEFVDEAHRLFTNSTRYNEMLARMFSRTMVEGRSLGHGVILSLQNASQVPSLMLNNINTHIVMKQNNREVAKAATQTMGENFADQSLTLGTGEALCKMFESPVVVIAQMAPSPYDLERTDNMGQTT